MKNAPTLVLPVALLESADYLALDAAEKKDFAARTQYYREMSQKINDFAPSNNEELMSIIDDLELDSLSIIGLSTGVATVSVYRIHSSWTFECESGSLIKYVEPDVKEFLSATNIGLYSTNNDIFKWLEKWAKCFALTLNHLEMATSFTEAIALLVTINALISKYLTFAAIYRLITIR